MGEFELEDWETKVYYETLKKIQEIIRETLDQAQMSGKISEEEKLRLIDWYKDFDLDWEYFYIYGDSYIKEYKRGKFNEEKSITMR